MYISSNETSTPVTLTTLGVTEVGVCEVGVCEEVDELEISGFDSDPPDFFLLFDVAVHPLKRSAPHKDRASNEVKCSFFIVVSQL